MNKKIEPLTAATINGINGNDTTTDVSSLSNIAHKTEEVNILRELRESATTEEIVSAVQQIHPKYDKTLQSKCEHTDEYGVCLEPKAMKMLIDKFAHLPSTAETIKRKDTHKLHDRATCRVEADTMARLKEKMQQDGFTTVQGCVYFLIRAYIGGTE